MEALKSQRRLSKLVSQLSSSVTTSESEYWEGNNSGNTSNFRYTLDSHADNVFTYKQRKFYEDNGYIIIKNIFKLSQIKSFYSRFIYLIKNPSKRGTVHIMRDISLNKQDRLKRIDPSQVTKMQGWKNDKYLWKYPSNENLLKYIKAFCGDNIRAMHLMVINKPSDSGALTSRHPIHQDEYFFPFGPSDHIVCSWTALDNVTRNNGCLCVIPGSHKSNKLFDHDYPKKNEWNGPSNKGYQSIICNNINSILRKRIHLEMNIGDTVFFHPLLLHGSSSNLSNANRPSISVHFASTTLCKYFNYKRIGQINSHKEIEDMARILTGYKGNIDEKILWKNKSKHVIGKKGYLG